jgi:hypothetical protein
MTVILPSLPLLLKVLVSFIKKISINGPIFSNGSCGSKIRRKINKGEFLEQAFLKGCLGVDFKSTFTKHL